MHGTSQPLWKMNKVTDLDSGNLKDVERFPLGLSQSLSASNKLLMSQTCSPNIIRLNNYNQEEINRLPYSGFISIQNTINNIIPYQISMLNLITLDFENLNINNMIYALIIILSYGVIMIFLSILYLVFLYLTNKNMQEGYEKASHKKLDKVNETIYLIEFFNDKYYQDLKTKINMNNNTRPK